MKKLSKLKQRILSMLAAVMLIASCLGMNVFAAGTSSITINAPSGTNLGTMKINAYQILTDTNSVTNNFTSFFSNAETQYKSMSSVNTVFLSYDSVNHRLDLSTAWKEGAISLILSAPLSDTYFTADLLSKITDATYITSLSNWMTDYVKYKNPTDGTGGVVKKVTANNESSLTISGLDNGYYLIDASDIPSNIAMRSNILNLASDSPLTLDLKAVSIPLDKTVGNPSQSGWSYADDATAKVGDTLKYQLTTKTPDFSNYDMDAVPAPYYKITDSIEKQDINQATLKVTFNGNKIYAYAPGLGEYDLQNIAEVTVGADSRDFTIDFDVEKLETLGFSEADVVVSYDAVLAEDALTINNNTGKVEFTNDFDSDSDGKQEDKTKVYTYGIEVIKKFSDNDFSHAAEAEFKLYDSSNQEILFKGTAGDYTKAKTDGNATLKANSADGSLNLFGLDEGTYTLKETKVPDGFAKMVDVTIVLKANTSDKSELDINNCSAKQGSAVISISKGATANKATIKFDVLNQKTDFELPTTGDAGVWMFTIGGVVIFSLAVIGFIVVRRKKNS